MCAAVRCGHEYFATSDTYKEFNKSTSINLSFQRNFPVNTLNKIIRCMQEQTMYNIISKI